MKNLLALKVLLTTLLGSTNLLAQTATTWTGNTSSAWNVDSNWTNGVPTATSTVTIGSASNNPILPSNVTIAQLTLNDGADLNLGSHTLTITSGITSQNSGSTKTVRNGNVVLGSASTPATLFRMRRVSMGTSSQPVNFTSHVTAITDYWDDNDYYGTFILHLRNNGTANILLGGRGNTFHSNTEIYQYGPSTGGPSDDGVFTIGCYSPNTNQPTRFKGPTTIHRMANHNRELYVARASDPSSNNDVIFEQDVTFINQGSAGSIQLARLHGKVRFEGNLNIQNISSTFSTHEWNDGSVSTHAVTLSSNTAINTTGSTGGTIRIRKLTQEPGFTGTHTFQIANHCQLDIAFHNVDGNGATTELYGNVVFQLSNVSAGEGIRVAQNSGCQAIFHGNVSIINNGSTISNLFRCAHSGSVTINGNVTISSSGGSGNRIISIADGTTGSGTVLLAANRSINASGVTVGQLNINRVTQISGTNAQTHNIAVPTTVDVYMRNNTLHGNLTVTGNRVQLIGNTLGSTAANTIAITLTGSNANGSGNNTYNGSVTFTYQSSSSLQWNCSGHSDGVVGGPDTFNANATFVNNGSGSDKIMTIASSSIGNMFHGSTTFTNNGGLIFLAGMSPTAFSATVTSSATFNGPVIFNNYSNGGTESGRDGAISIARSGGARVVFKNSVSFNNFVSNSAQGAITVATYGGVTFEGNITINQSGGSSAFNTHQQHFQANGRIFMEGGANQTLTSNQPVVFRYLQINKIGGSRLILNSDVEISRNTNVATSSPELVLTSGLIELGNHNLTLVHDPSWPALLNGGSANSYVIATGSGRFFRRVANSATLFPVGTSSSYLPLTITNSGTADMFGVRVVNLSAAPYNINSYFVSHGWDVIENTNGGSANALTAQWNAANELTNFNRNQSAFYRWNGSWFSCLEAQNAASGSGPYSRNISGLNATNSVGIFAIATAFADADVSATNIISVSACGGFNLNANVNPFTGPGQWSQVSGPTTVTFADPTSPTSSVSGMTNGTYVLRWTTSHGCSNAFSDVTVNFTYTAPVPVANCTWTGAANNGVWSDCANWLNNDVPGEISPGVFSNVTIPGGLTTMYPTLQSNVTVNNFTMTAGASINLATFTLQIRGTSAVAGSTITSNGGMIHKTSNSNDTWNGGNTFNGSLTIRHSGNGGVLTLANNSGNTFNSTVGSGGIAAHTYVFDIAHSAAEIVLSPPTITNTVTGNLEFKSVRNSDFQAGSLSFVTNNIHSTVKATDLQPTRRVIIHNYTINRSPTSFTLTLYGLFTVNNTITLTNGRTLLADGTNLLLANSNPTAIVGVTGPTQDGIEIAPGDIYNQGSSFAGTGTFSWSCAPNATPYRFPTGFGGWNAGNSRWGRMSAFTFTLQSGSDIITVRSVGFIPPAQTYDPVTNARTGNINFEHVNLQWLVTCANPSSSLQFTNVLLPWRQYGPGDNFEQSTFVRGRSGIVRYHHGLAKWECIMPVGTPTSFATDQYSHTATTVLTKTNSTNLGVFSVGSVTSNVSLTPAAQNTPCRTITLNASANLGSPAGGQWVFISGPSTPVIANPTQPITQAVGATADGNYTFEWRRFSPECGGTLTTPIHGASVTINVTGSGTATAGATSTWTGIVSSAWNDCANWSDGVPSTITNVTIPSSAPHWPQLSSDVNINRIVTNAGAQINLQNFKLTTTNRTDPGDPTTIAFSARNIFQNTTIHSTTGVTNFHLSNNSAAYIIGPLSQFRSCTFTGDINLLETSNHNIQVDNGGNTFQERARLSNTSRSEWRWGVAAEGGKDVFEKDTWIEVNDQFTASRQGPLPLYGSSYNTVFNPVWTGGTLPTTVPYISPPYYVPGSGAPYTGVKVGFPNYPRNDIHPTNHPDPAVNAANFATNQANAAANAADEAQSEANIAQATQNARDAANRAFSAIGTLTSEINTINTIVADSPIPTAALPCANAAAITAAHNALTTAINDANSFKNGALQTAANNAEAAANDTNLATSTPGQDNAAANAANSAANTAQTHRTNMWTALNNYLSAINTCINAYNSSASSASALLNTGVISMAYNTANNEFKQNTYVNAINNGRVFFAFENGSSVRFGGTTPNPALVADFNNSSSGGNWGAINVARRGTALFNVQAVLRQNTNIRDEFAAIRIYRENTTAGAVTFNNNLTVNGAGQGFIYFGEVGQGVANGVTLNADFIVDSNLSDATTDHIHNGGLFINNFTKNSASPFTIITEANGRLSMEMTNVFNGNAVLENRSTGNGQRISHTNAASSTTFNGNVTLRNTAVSMMHISGMGNVQFNGNLVVENTFNFLTSVNDPNRCGICIGQHSSASASGTTTLAAGKTITVGPNGYASGTLLLQRFTQQGTGTTQNITLTSPQSEISLMQSTFHSSVTLEAPELRIRNSIFQPTAADGTAFTHLIVNARGENSGGNTFHEPTTLELRGVRSATLNPVWTIGETDKDDFLDEVTFINSGDASHFNIANRNSGHVFVRKVTFINGKNSSTSSDILGERNRMRIAQSSTANVVFQNDVVVENRQSTEGEIAFARNGEITIHGNLSLSNVKGQLLFGGGDINQPTLATEVGKVTLNGTLTLQNGWQKGMLMLRHFVSNNTAPITLVLPATNPDNTAYDNTLVIGKNGSGRSHFKASSFTAKARVLLLNGATYEGTNLLFEKLGAGVNECQGDNDFQGISKFVNHSTSNFVLARSEPDIFGNNVTFEEIGDGRINPAFKGINQFKGDITVISPNDRNFEFSRDIGSEPASGIVQIAGASTQNLVNNISNPVREISFRALEMNQVTGSSLLIPNRNFTIRTSAVFKRGKIQLNDKILTILNHTNPASVAVVGSNLDDSYVMTNSTGTVRRTVVAAGSSSVTVLFPVGNTTSYLALGLRQNGAAAVTDVYNVRVRDGVHVTYDASNNPTGSAINRLFINGAWVVTENVNGGTNAEAFLYWKDDDELPYFQRTQCAIMRYNKHTNKWRCTQGMGNVNGSSGSLFWRISGGTATEINDVGVFSVASVIALATTPITTCGSGPVTMNAVPLNDAGVNAVSPFEGEWSFVSASDNSLITIPPAEKNKWNATIPGLQAGVTYTFKWTLVGLEGACTPGPSIDVTVIVDPSTPINGVLVRWTGNANNSDWFDCRNWDRLFVPNNTHDVEIRNVSTAIPAPGLNMTDPNGLPNYTTTGTNTYPIIANATAYCRNLIIFPGASVTVQNGGEINVVQSVTNNHTFAIQNGGRGVIGLDLINTQTFTNQGEVYIGRSLLHNHTAPLNHTTGDIIFNGATNGFIGGTQPLHLHRVFVEKVGGLASTLTLTQPLTIQNRLQLTTGKVISSATNMLFLPVGTICNDGNPQSFVEGPIRRFVGNNQNFVFPTGRGNRWARISVTDLINAGASDHFTAEYFTNNPYPNGNAFMCPPGPNSLAPQLDHVSYVEHWTLDRNTGGTVQAKVALYWESPAPNASDIKLFSNLYVARYNGSCWENRGGNLYGTLSAGRVETPSRQNLFSPWTISTDLDEPLQPLPVELVSLKAELTPEGQGLISWTTSWEKEAAYFEVQRSANGKDFEPLGRVTAKGFSRAQQHYQFIDPRPLTGVNYYRLRQVDVDGSYKFSPIVDLVVASKEVFSLEVYPNPTSGYELKANLQAPYAERSTLSIYDLTGRLIWRQNVEIVQGRNQWQIEVVKHLAKGMYILQVDAIRCAARFVVD